MKEIILPPLRSHVPGVAAQNPKPTWHLPIHVYGENGIDLDFGPLLLFDRAVIDAASLEYIQTSNRKDLAPLARSLVELKDAGYIVARDFGSELDRARGTITKHVDRLLTDPLPLRSPLLRGIEGYNLSIAGLKKIGISYDEDVLTIGFGMHLMMMQKYGYINKDEKQRLDRLMISRKQRWSSEDLEDVRALIRPTITYLYQNLALGELLEAPFLDVDYTSELYTILREDSLLAFNAESNLQFRRIQEGQKLFNCIVPELRPSSVQAMLAFLKSKAVTDFREYISHAAEEGRSITTQDYKALLITTLDTEYRFRQLKDGLAWGERLISLIPGAGLLVSSVSLLLENVIYRKTAKKHQWLYALIKASGTGRNDNP